MIPCPSGIMGPPNPIVPSTNHQEKHQLEHQHSGSNLILQHIGCLQFPICTESHPLAALHSFLASIWDSRISLGFSSAAGFLLPWPPGSDDSLPWLKSCSSPCLHSLLVSSCPLELLRVLPVSVRWLSLRVAHHYRAPRRSCASLQSLTLLLLPVLC